MTLCVIQARLGSSRFPRKALADLGGKPLIRHVVERASAIRGVGEVVLAVPEREVVALCYCSHVVGPMVAEDDVLGRFAAVRAYYPEADTVMRLTGDCPLLDPRIAEQVLALYRATPGCEYAWNVAPGYIDGTDVEVFSAAALRWAHRCATDPYDREHVGPWIRRHCKVATLLPDAPSTLKTSVDTPDDLERVRTLMSYEWTH